MPDVLRNGRQAREAPETLPASLRGLIKPSDVGSRVVIEKPNKEEESLSKRKSIVGTKSIQEAIDRATAIVYTYFSDSPDGVVKSATESIITIVHDRSLGESGKKAEIDFILGEPMSSDDYHKLHTVCQQIPHDWNSLDNGLVGGFESSESSDESDETEETDASSDVDSSLESAEESFNPRIERKRKGKNWSRIDNDPSIVISGSHSLNLQDVDGSWLLNKLTPINSQLAPVMTAMDQPNRLEIEKSLYEIIGGDNLELVKLLAENAPAILWLTRLHRADSGPEREAIRSRIEENGLEHILRSGSDQAMAIDGPHHVVPETIDLDILRSELTDNASRVVKNLALPEGSTKFATKTYEQYNVPPTPSLAVDTELTTAVADLPPWAQIVFQDIKTLNPIQSRVAPTALETEDNILMCAPTGAGKTNVALLAMAQCFHADPNAKVVYLAPLKALVQEQVRAFTKRLESLNLKVCELSGDQSISRDQMAETSVIVATPEKWDVVSRKPSNLPLTSSVKLLVIDEIHLLHDKRGPVLENIVSRIHMSPSYFSRTRLVGLSATLPNYLDVAAFLQAKKEATFWFGPEYRPCPLSQAYIGVTDPNPVRRMKSINEACFDKVEEHLKKSNQIIVFVQSRKDTSKTALYLIERLSQLGMTSLVANQSPDHGKLDDSSLENLLVNGIGTHHAGLSRNDRSIMESQFSSGKLKILVSTSTLAWGVNLPAHTVILKGTQYYNPHLSAWTELSPQDVLQMLGRAGRPGFDVEGDGIIITTHSQLNYYMSVATASLAIESQLIDVIVDSLNAEICFGSITSLDDAVKWLGLTYYYIRMVQDSAKYRVQSRLDNDPYLSQWRRTIVFSALLELAKHRCILPIITKEGTVSSTIVATDLGRIAANFYISPHSVATYAKQLKPWLSTTDVFRVFCFSKEFSYIHVRNEERAELAHLVTVVPVPVRESADTKAAKIQVLLQAFICKLSLSGFALAADTSFIAQSASRLFRAMMEIALLNRWATLTNSLLDIYKMIDHKMFLTSSPFRQFLPISCPREIIRKSESSQIPWDRYFDLGPVELGEALRNQELGDIAYTLLRSFPRFKLTAQIQPLTPTVYMAHIDIDPCFEWDDRLHHNSEHFLLTLENYDESKIFAAGRFSLQRKHATRCHYRSFALLLDRDPGPFMIAKLSSERWLHSVSRAPIDLRPIIEPSKSIPALPQYFQDQLDGVVGDVATSLIIGTPDSAEKYRQRIVDSHIEVGGTVLYVTPFPHIVPDLVKNWSKRYGDGVVLTVNSDSLDIGDGPRLMVLAVDDWELWTRRWRHHPFLAECQAILCDSIETVGGVGGNRYEAAIARTKYWATQLDLTLRWVGLGLPLACSRSMGQWLGVAKQNVYTFLDRSENHQIEVKALPSFTDMFDSQVLIALQAIVKCLEGQKSAVVVVPDKSQTAVAAELFLSAGIENVSVFSGERLSSPEQDSILIVPRSSTHYLPESCRSRPIYIAHTQVWDGAECGYVDYTATEISRFLSQAGEKATVFTPSSRVSYYGKFLTEPIPVESNLLLNIKDIIAVEIASGSISSGEEALDWLTYTFMFCRLRLNPSFYGIHDPKKRLHSIDEAISEFLSETVEGALEQLADNRIVQIEDEETLEVSPLNGAMIVARDAVSQSTVWSLQQSPARNIRGILTVITSGCREFDQVITLSREDIRLSRYIHDLPFNGSLDTSDPGEKALVLLQLLMSRKVPKSLQEDALCALRKSLTILKAAIDVYTGEGELVSTLAALDAHQQLTQSVWSEDSSLLQIPHVDRAAVQRCRESGIESAIDFVAIEDDDLRAEILGFDDSDPRMIDVAAFANHYPNIDVKAHLDASINDDDSQLVHVTIQREIDEDDDTVVVCRNLEPRPKEMWYVIVGNAFSGELFGAAKTEILTDTVELDVKVTLPSYDDSDSLTLWCVCNGYIDADKEIAVRAGEDEEDDNESSADEADQKESSEGDIDPNENSEGEIDLY